MYRPRACFFIYIAIALTNATVAYASGPTTAAEFAVTTAQSLLSSAPLPNLQGGQTTLSPQIGLVSGKYDLNVPTPTGESYQSTGSVAGSSAGLSWSQPSRGEWGFFWSFIGSSTTGETQAKQGGMDTYQIKDMKSQVLAGMGGFTYRMIGNVQSVFALGYFAGPSVISVNSSSVFVPALGIDPQPTTFEFNPLMYGLFQGFQFNLWLGKFLINPYVILNIDVSDSCKTLKITSGPNPGEITCMNGKLGADIMSSFPAVGLFLGYGKLRVNVYAKTVMDAPSMNVTTATVSYGLTW